MYQKINERKQNAGMALCAALVLLLSACGIAGQAPGELGSGQRILATCPDARLASKVDVDVSGSARTTDLVAERIEIIRDAARRTAICGGHLRVTAFSSSSAATTTLFDGDVVVPGATDIARLRKVPHVVESVMAEITPAYDAVLSTPPTDGGSDIVAQYRLGQEYLAQLGDGYELSLWILTDGFQTTGRGIVDRALTSAEAAELASQIDLPDLTDASITVAGLGRVAGQAPTTDVVDGLVAFYDALCDRSQAASCLSVTDYVAGGGEAR